MLHGIGKDINIRIDLARFPNDGLNIENIARDVGGAHHAQQQRVLIDLAEYLIEIDAAGLGVRHRHAEFPVGQTAVKLHRVISRWMLNGCYDCVGAPFFIAHNGAHDLEHHLRGRQLRHQCAGLCAEDHLHDIAHAVRFDLLEHHGGVVDTFGAVGDFFQPRFFLDSGLQAQRTAGIFKKLALSAEIILVHVVELVLDLLQKSIVEQNFLVCNHDKPPHFLF